MSVIIIDSEDPENKADQGEKNTEDNGNYTQFARENTSSFLPLSSISFWHCHSLALLMVIEDAKYQVTVQLYHEKILLYMSCA